MGDNNVDASFNSRIITDLKAFQKENPEAKNLKQLNTIFSAMDKNNSGTIEEDEGTLFYYSDGTISATKCEKSVGNDGKITEHYKMFMGANDNGVYEYDSDGNVTRASFVDGTVETYGKEYTKSVVQQDDKTFEFGYNKDKELVYKKLTDKDGKVLLLSPKNNKVMAGLEKDGSIRTFHNTRDSFEGTMQRLGIINDEKAVEEFKKANPHALGMKYGDRFTLTANDPMAMPVVIPKSILERYNVVFGSNGIELRPKAEGESKTQPWDEEEVSNPSRKAALESYAEQLRNNGEIVVQGQIAIPNPDNNGDVIVQPVEAGVKPVQKEAKPVDVKQEAPADPVSEEIKPVTSEVKTKEVEGAEFPGFKEAIVNIPNPPELVDDKNFQKYRKSLIDDYKEMARCASVGGWEMGTKPDQIDSFKKVDHLDEWAAYTKLSTRCERTNIALENYVLVMQNWQDGTQFGDRQINTIKFHSPVEMTLKDGQHAWKCEEGVFYPYHDGFVGGPRVPEELIP